MAEHPRIEELRRRVQKDKASIAFAQLAEEYRRAGRFQEAIDTCRTGLEHHPGYLSAHVTLGRALIEVGELAQAHGELTQVLDAAPENLAALKGLAEIHYRQGERPEALAHYRRALEFAPNDPDLEHLVAQISRELEPEQKPAPVPGGLSFEEAMGEFLAFGGPAAASQPAPEDLSSAGLVPVVPDEPAGTVPAVVPDLPDVALHLPDVALHLSDVALDLSDVAPDLPDVALHLPEAVLEPPDTVGEPPADADAPAVTAVLPASPLPEDFPGGEPLPPRAALQVAALEHWLDTILAERRKRT